MRFYRNVKNENWSYVVVQHCEISVLRVCGCGVAHVNILSVLVTTFYCSYNSR